MEHRKPLIAGNWKMFKTCFEAETTARELVNFTSDVKNIDVMIAPPFTALSPVSKIIHGSSVSLGAQNLFWEREGAYTGEISAPMLMSVECKYVIIGHSERRQYFGETDETIPKKIKAALDHQLIPIMCVGETEKEQEANETFSVLDKQIKNGLKGFVSDYLKPLVIAYEPVWAIGTGKTATSGQAQETQFYIRSLINTLFGNELAQSIRILYGGSVKPNNISELMAMPDIDGALVGGASLNARTFSEIIHYKI